jgi:ribosomal protein S18 acetylase RimI-like enzyme
VREKGARDADVPPRGRSSYCVAPAVGQPESRPRLWLFVMSPAEIPMIHPDHEVPVPSAPPSAQVVGAVLVRPAEARDAGGVAALFVECDGGAVEPHREGFARAVAGMGGAEFLVVAEAGGRIVGFGRIRRFERPPACRAGVAPEGWYLLGVQVAPAFRRAGIGSALTRVRLRWISRRADEAFYFTQAGNRASILLHRHLGFREIARGLEFPGAPPSSDARLFFRLDLRSTPPRRPEVTRPRLDPPHAAGLPSSYESGREARLESRSPQDVGSETADG